MIVTCFLSTCYKPYPLTFNSKMPHEMVPYGTSLSYKGKVWKISAVILDSQCVKQELSEGLNR